MVKLCLKILEFKEIGVFIIIEIEVIIGFLKLKCYIFV